jgi:hypothetical protein
MHLKAPIQCIVSYTCHISMPLTNPATPCFARVSFLKHGCTPEGEITGGELLGKPREGAYAFENLIPF